MQEIPHISFYMKVLLHQFQHECTEVLSRLGLTASQTDVLLYVAMSPVGNICQRDIEHFFHLSNPTVTGILWRLEQKGFISRAADPVDGRRKTVRPTEKAKELLKKIYELNCNIEERLLAPLDRSEQETMFRLLEKMLTSLICHSTDFLSLLKKQQETETLKGILENQSQ